MTTLLSPSQFILQGRYRVEEFIGRGAFTEVFRATNIGTDGARALKVISRKTPGLSENEFSEHSNRFRLEGRLYELLKDNPHILKVYELEEEGDLLIQVLDYAAGGSLADYITNNHPIPISEVLHISLGIAEGLSEIHTQNIVHRDLKPANVLLDANGNAQVADFGYAQAHKLSGRSLYGSGADFHPGAPAYMSPEQASEKGYLQPNSDVYAFGCLVFELLTGQVYKNQRPGTSIKSLRPDTPVWLEMVVLRCVSIDPEERPWNGVELCKLIQLGLEEKTATFEFQERITQEETPEEMQDRLTREQTATKLPPFWKRIPLFAWIVIALLVVFSVILGIINTRDGREPSMTTIVDVQPDNLSETANQLIDEAAPSMTFTASQTMTATETASPTFTPTSTLTFTVTTTQTFTPSPTPLPVAIVKYDNANVRYGPSSIYPIILKLSKGDERGILGQSLDGTFIVIQLADGREGWIALELLDIDVNTATLEQYEIPPTPILYKVTIENDDFDFAQIKGPHGYSVLDIGQTTSINLPAGEYGFSVCIPTNFNVISRQVYESRCRSEVIIKVDADISVKASTLR